jgi:Tfp pilus assembly protein PilV
MVGRFRRDDTGDSLIEILVAVVIMGVAVVAVIGGLLSSVKVSDYHRKQATAGEAARDYAEAVTASVTGYTACAGASTYAAGAVNFSAPAGFSATPLSVRYWIGGAWTASGCSASTDTGLQQVTVRVASSDGRASEQVVVVVRKPCGAGSSCT